MRDLTVGLMYNQPVQKGENFWESSVDVLHQVEAIETALTTLGSRSVRIPFAGDLDKLLARLRWDTIDLVFNLCESVNEDPCLIGHPAAVLELLQIPFTGAPALALMLSTDKLLSKQLFIANNINSPSFVTYDGGTFLDPGGLRFPVILKPRFQDASIGIDQDSICRNAKELNDKAMDLHSRHGSLLAEEYIDGREFNVSLLGFPEPVILPIGEIDFSAFPDDLLPIVGYRAKWDSSSFEFHHTPRVFSDTLSLPVLKTLRQLARECFHTFMLRDYGRVDFRVDHRQLVYVLEVNGNPCLSPDAGFAAAAAQKNLSYPELISTIIHCVLQRSKNNDSCQANCER
jgi:D-alanine-D-alanine ligase